jgi:hypothetical protein
VTSPRRPALVVAALLLAAAVALAIVFRDFVYREVAVPVWYVLDRAARYLETVPQALWLGVLAASAVMLFLSGLALLLGRGEPPARRERPRPADSPYRFWLACLQFPEGGGLERGYFSAELRRLATEAIAFRENRAPPEVRELVAGGGLDLPEPVRRLVLGGRGNGRRGRRLRASAAARELELIVSYLETPPAEDRRESGGTP